jgi:hypothetical protein
MNLKKVLYENYGVLIKDTEDMFWRHIISNNTQKKLSEALEEFSETTELQYFNHRHFNDIANKLVKEEISPRDQESGYNPKNTQNIKHSDILFHEYNIDESDEEDKEDNDGQHVFNVNYLANKVAGNTGNK